MNIPLLPEDRLKGHILPKSEEVISVLEGIGNILFPAFYSPQEDLEEEMLDMIAKALRFGNDEREAEEVLKEFLSKLPEVKAALLTDLQAIYDGDPAATCKEEIIICYPGFYATLTHRIAHVFYQLRVPIIPRIMSEHAHSKTGIDINPGASIGEYFCIDHGTGVVIGETAVLGHHVKLYQGVTIGAKSFKLDADGNPVKGGKRHPNIGNNVIIYANATILGGDTYIADNVVIGASSWITHSITEEDM